MKNVLTEINREDVQKILKKNPVWISRMSILVSFIVISIILFISFYIKYPIVINSRLKVISVDETGTINGKIFVNKNDLASIKPGQDIKVTLDRYNTGEYGFLKGNIKSISSVQEDGQESDVNIFILNNFRTNKGKDTEIKNEMEGNIEIITDKVPMIKKLLKSIKIIPSGFLDHLILNSQRF